MMLCEMRIIPESSSSSLLFGGYFLVEKKERLKSMK